MRNPDPRLRRPLSVTQQLAAVATATIPRPIAIPFRRVVMITYLLGLISTAEEEVARRPLHSVAQPPALSCSELRIPPFARRDHPVIDER